MALDLAFLSMAQMPTVTFLFVIGILSWLWFGGAGAGAGAGLCAPVEEGGGGMYRPSVRLHAFLEPSKITFSFSPPASRLSVPAGIFQPTTGARATLLSPLLVLLVGNTSGADVCALCALVSPTVVCFCC
jgi:hypothetical protein